MEHINNFNNQADGQPTATTIKRLVGRTPSVIKSKFLSVLGNSSDIITGISNKVRQSKRLFIKVVFYNHLCLSNFYFNY